MILAAGLGTRLGKLTADTPKCLLRAGGKTMLEHAIDNLVRVGVSELAVNVHYLAPVVERFIREHSFPVPLTISHEPELLGTGGGLAKLAGFFEGEQEFLLYNADVFTDFDLSKLVEQRRATDALGVLAMMRREEESYLLFNARDQLCGYRRPPQEPDLVRNEQCHELAFCGIQVLSGRIFKYLPHRKPPYSTIGVFLEAAKQGETIMGHCIDGSYWIDMGTPEKLEQLRGRLG